MIVAFVMINCAKDAIPELAEKLCGINGVGEVYSVTGDFDVIAIVRVIELSQVAEVVTGEIRKL